MADGLDISLKGFDQYKILLGDQLRGERATMGKSLLDVQRDLKIKASYISAIEDCDLQVFSNKGFVPGYVRSYARYLELDPEEIYERFCLESGYSAVDKNLTLQIKKSNKSFQKQYSESSNWSPGRIGQLEHKNNIIWSLVSQGSPVVLLLLVIAGVSVGALSVLKEVQKLDVVVFDDLPDIDSENLVMAENYLDFQASEEVYSSEELALPVFEPRDKPLSTLKPDLLTALDASAFSSNLESEALNIYAGPLRNQVSRVIKSYEQNEIPTPVIRTTPSVPKVQLFAATPAWVRLRNDEGIVVLEKILAKGESYPIKKGLFGGTLRAGNAQNVYFVIDEKVYGPLSHHKSVVKNVLLDPIALEADLNISVPGHQAYFMDKSDTILLNTAERFE